MSPEVFNHYKTGIDEMDLPHWEVIDSLNKAKDLSDLGQMSFALAAVKKAFDLLKAEFEAEESKMSQARYPYAYAHVRAHAMILKSAEDTLNVVSNGYRYTSMRYTLGIWQRDFLDHIDQYDAQYAEFIQRQENS
jgi:hemerythrin-like metal-binding protein